MLTINYGTGAGNETAVTLEEAMKTADTNVVYTQTSITIEDKEGNILAFRRWNNTLDCIEEYENPIQFGDYGYYSDWEIE